MDRLFAATIIISLVFLTVTYLLNRFFRRKRIIKYIPALISLIFAVVNMVLARQVQGDGFRDLARILMAIFLFTGFVSGLLGALYFDYVSPRLKKRN